MRFISLKTKMSIIVSMLVTVLMVALAFLVISRFEKRFRETVSSRQLALIDEMAEDIDRSMERARKVLVATANSLPAYALKDAALAQAVLASSPALLTIFDNGLHLFAPDGRLIAEIPDLHRQGSDYSYREYFRKTLESGKPYISAPFLSSHGQHHPSIMFTAPVFDHYGKMIAILGGNVDLTKDNILGEHARVEIGKSGYVYIYDTQRTMIMHPDRSRIMKRDVPPGVNPVFDKGIAGFNGTEETVNTSGMHFLTTVRGLKTTNWIMAANYPLDEAYAPIRDAVRFSVLAVAVGILTSLLVVWLSMKTLTAPLVRLTRHITKIAELEGDEKVILIESGDEIEELAAAFNGTMRNLTVKQEELVKLSVTLKSALGKAEMERKRSEVIVAAIGDPITVLDTDFRIITQNTTGMEMMGNHVGLRCYEAYHLSDKPCDGCLMVEALLDGEVHRGDKKYHHQDGTYRHLSFTVSPVSDSTDATIAVIELVRDITEQKQSELRLAIQLAVSEILAESITVEEAIPWVLEAISTSIGWDLGGIWWADQRVNRLHLINCWSSAEIDAVDFVAASRAMTFAPGIGLPGRVWASGQESWIDDLLLDDNYPRKPFAMASGLRSAFAFPITLGGVTVGVMEFYSREVRKFDPSLLHVMATLGGQVGQLIERKQAEGAFRESERRFRETLENIRLLAIELDAVGTILFCNDYLLNLTGWRKEEVLGRNWFDYFVPSDSSRQETYLMWINKGTMPTHQENEILTRNDELRQISWNITLLYAADGTSCGMACIGEDITDRKAAEERLRYMSMHDALTGLYNRAFFDEELNRLSLGRQLPISVIMADVDGLKKVNDTYGHASGDRLIRMAAEVLLQSFRTEDVVARIGGDEFAVLLPATSAAEADEALARIRKCQDGANVLNDDFTLSISLGVATSRSGKGLVNALKLSDERMYRNKSAGKKRLSAGQPSITQDMIFTYLLKNMEITS